MSISSSSQAATTPPKVNCKDVITAADAALKAKQDALDEANVAINKQTTVITDTTKQLNDTETKLHSLPHNTYAVAGVGISSGILLGAGSILPGVGLMIGIIIIGLFQ